MTRLRTRTSQLGYLLSLAGALLAASACSSSDDPSGATGTGGSTSASTATSGSGGQTSGWQTLAPLGGGPRQETAVVALDSEIYVIGGFNATAQIVPDVEAYDPATDTWRSIAPLPEPRHHANAAAVDGKLYVVGALFGLSFSAHGASWVYDPQTDSWSDIATMPAGSERGGGTVSVVGSKIYVVGGFRQGAVQQVSAYDTVSDSWEELAALPQARDHLVGGAANGLVYAIGGRDGTIESIVPRVDVYDPATDSWDSGTAMPTARGGCAAATIGSRIYVLGGEGNMAAESGVFPDVEVYDTTTDSWEVLAPMVTPRHGTAAAAVDGVIYVPGGATQQAFGAVATHEAYVP